MKPASKWLSLGIVLSALLLSVIDVFIINVAIPAIRVGIHATEAEVQLVIAVYLLGYASFLVTGGRLGDHYGRKRVFLLGMVCFTLASCWCGFSHSPLELNIARFIQGVSASVMVPQTIAFIQVLFPDPKERAKAIGWYGITLGLSSMLGLFLGGVLTYFPLYIAGWRLIFFINLPIGIVAVWMGIRYLQETPLPAARRFDLGGVALLTLALFFLIIPLIQGRELGWPLWSILLLPLSLGLFVLFFHNQRVKKSRDRNPLIDTSLFRFRDLNIGLLAVICCFVVHNSYLLASTILLQNGFGFNPLYTGSAFVVFGFSFLLFSVWSIRLVGSLGKWVVLAGVILMFVALGAQTILFTGEHLPLGVLVGLLLAHGAGAGFTYPTLLNVTLKSVPVEYAGAASGIYVTAQQAASALGVAIVGGIFFTVLNHHTGEFRFQAAFRSAALADMAVLAVMGALVCALPAGRINAVALVE